MLKVSQTKIVPKEPYKLNENQRKLNFLEKKLVQSVPKNERRFYKKPVYLYENKQNYLVKDKNQLSLALVQPKDEVAAPKYSRNSN